MCFEEDIAVSVRLSNILCFSDNREVVEQGLVIDDRPRYYRWNVANFPNRDNGAVVPWCLLNFKQLIKNRKGGMVIGKVLQ